MVDSEKSSGKGKKGLVELLRKWKKGRKGRKGEKGRERIREEFGREEWVEIGQCVFFVSRDEHFLCFSFGSLAWKEEETGRTDGMREGDASVELGRSFLYYFPNLINS